MTPTTLADTSARAFVRLRTATLVATGALIALARAHKPTRRGVAKALVFAGGLLAALGVALIYLPAGVIVAGIGLIVWALLIFDLETPR